MKQPLARLLSNDIFKTGLILFAFGLVLVTILALVQNMTADQIVIAQEEVNRRLRSKIFPSVHFSPQKIYIIQKKSGKMAYQIFKDIVDKNISDSPDFNELLKKDTIEFVVLKKEDKIIIKDRLQLKDAPIQITPEQFAKLETLFKKERLTFITYHEAYDGTEQDSKFKGWVIQYNAKQGYGGDIGLLIGFNTDKKITGYQMINHNETPGLGTKGNDSDFIKGFINKDPLKMPTSKQDYKNALGIDAISGATITSLALSRGIKQAYQVLYVKDVDPSKKEEKPIDPKTDTKKDDKNTNKNDKKPDLQVKPPVTPDQPPAQPQTPVQQAPAYNPNRRVIIKRAPDGSIIEEIITTP